MDNQKTYLGLGCGERRRLLLVTEIKEEGECTSDLDPRVDLKRCDLLGRFEWGVCGPGANQLALALLADCLDDNAALEMHEDFGQCAVALLSRDWEMAAADILAFALVWSDWDRKDPADLRKRWLDTVLSTGLETDGND